MVKKSTSGDPAGPARPDGDAVSLNTQPGDRYLHDDAPELQIDDINPDDLPPQYSPTGESSGTAPLLSQEQPNRPRDLADFPPTLTDQNTGACFYIDRRLEQDPDFLERWICGHAANPPEPVIKILGTHTETRRERNDKNKRETVTDFDLEIDLTPYLFSDATNRVSWRRLRTADNGVKARRGTVLAKRAPGFTQDIEVGGAEKPTLREWCHRYCASPAGLKAFRLRREVTGMDKELLREKIETLVRGLNYHGHLQVSFPMRGEIFEAYNDCRTNRWRLTTWVQILCSVTLMFIFTWPYLFFRTKRFEVVTAEWPFARPLPHGGEGREFVSISEEQLYNMWARALGKAALERRQGPLNQQDLRSAQGAAPTFQAEHGTADEAALARFLQAGMNAMNAADRHRGWGWDV